MHYPSTFSAADTVRYGRSVLLIVIWFLYRAKSEWEGDADGDTESGRIKLTLHTSIVWLNIDVLDLAMLDRDGISLAAVLSEQLGTLKGGIECFGEFASRVGKEADVAGFGRVERFRPGFHARRGVSNRLSR